VTKQSSFCVAAARQSHFLGAMRHGIERKIRSF
jgi:hypothetical protein